MMEQLIIITIIMPFFQITLTEHGNLSERLSAVINGDVFYHDFSFELPDPSMDSTYEINNLSVVSYICERNNFNVLQAIKTELEN